MAEMRLTIQHNGVLFEPPVEEGVKIEWERSGAPGKLTFTTIKIPNAGMSFSEGDAVCFYYSGKPIFMGYVFTKRRDREHHIEVTCYDQLRYLKNKFTYLFENKKASEIISSMCNDLNLQTGSIEDTGYVIPAVAEENKAAFDIALDVISDTLLNTGNMYVLYDDFGKITLKNAATMIATNLIMEDTAENFDYKSSIDDETYNSIILYYKEDDHVVALYSAQDKGRIEQWGTLRYFEEVKNKTVAMNKAKSLLELYCRKSRTLTISDAFGDTSIRGGTLIPVKLYLGDIDVSNYMLVQKVTHKFNKDYYTMDLTLDGAWEDTNVNGSYAAIGDTSTSNSSTSSDSGYKSGIIKEDDSIKGGIATVREGTIKEDDSIKGGIATTSEKVYNNKIGGGFGGVYGQGITTRNDY